MKEFRELYRQDVLNFKKQFDTNYIKNVFDAYEKVKDKLDALALIRDTHLSRMFSFLLTSYFIKKEPDKISDAISITIKNLGDAVVFLTFYKKKFKELPYGPFRKALKQHLDSLDDEKIELFKYFTVNDKTIQKYLAELGYEINEEFLGRIFQNNPDKEILIYAATSQYKPLLKSLFSQIRKPPQETTINFAASVLENKKVLDNNDVPMLMLYLHYSAFKKVGAEHPQIQPLTKKIARALEKAIDYKMSQLLGNGIVFWDVYFIDTVEGKRPLEIKNTKFKFYVDEILSAVAVTNAVGEEVHIVSDNIHTVRVYGKFAKRFSAFVKMMLEHRTSSLNTNFKLKVERDSLVLVPHEAYIPVVKKMLVKPVDVRVVFYAPSESAKDMWPELIGFSERIANFLTNP